MEQPPVPSKTWELSLYELQRTPQEAITDSTEIAVSPRSLHSELMCPICLDMLKNTMTTKECLHRFCQDCIITALRSGNKECPTCRKKLVSKRSLRPDPNFDSLITKIYPSRDEYEALQEKVLAKFKTPSQAFVKSIEEGMKLQAMNKAQRARPAKRQELPPGMEAPSPKMVDGQTPPTTPLPGQLPDDLEPELSLPDNETITPRKRPRATSEELSGGESSLSEPPPLPSFEANVRDLPSPEPIPPKPPVVEIELVFRPHPDEEQTSITSQTRYIKTTANATGIHLMQ